MSELRWYDVGEPTTPRRLLRDVCKNCGDEIRISIFKGGDWCCDDCRKALVAAATQAGCSDCQGSSRNGLVCMTCGTDYS